MGCACPSGNSGGKLIDWDLLDKQDWHVTIPPNLNGPMIHNVSESDGFASEVHVVAGDHDNVGIVWENIASDKLSREGKVVGLAVVSQDIISFMEYNPLIREDSCFSNILQDVTYTNDHWHVLALLWNEKEKGLALLDYNTHGQKQLRMLSIPHAAGNAWLFGDTNNGNVFWAETYWGKNTLPDFMGGVESQVVKGVELKQGKAMGERVVHERTRRFDVVDWEEDYQVVELGENRHDLFYKRCTDRYGVFKPSKIFHVSDLSSNRDNTRCIGQCQTLSTIRLVPKRGKEMQLLWMEDLTKEYEVDNPDVPKRLVEMRYDSHGWSRPRVVFQSKDWEYENMTATPIQIGEQEGTFVAWGNKITQCMVYSVCIDEVWSPPIETDLPVGSSIWLVPDQA